MVPNIDIEDGVQQAHTFDFKMSTQNRCLMKVRCAVAGCVLLLAVLLWRVAEDFRNPDIPTTAPLLDSFSEPGICVARLKYEAERLMLAYTEERDLEEAQLKTGRNSSPIGSFRGHPLADLHAAAQALSIDLDRKLLVLYYESGSWNELVDCYLRLVQQTPECTVGDAISYLALDCAQKCGRTEEVTETLRHIIRYHPGFHSIEGLKRALDSWERQHTATVAATRQ